MSTDAMSVRSLAFPWRSCLPAVPGLLIVLVAVVLPCVWLTVLSVLDDGGNLSPVNYLRLAQEQSYLKVFLTTFVISIETVAACMLIGLPLATFVASQNDRLAVIFVGIILFPLWTSLLVRAYAWLVILQRTGVVNTFLLHVGLIDDPLPLAFNSFATVLGMTHIMLPVFLLPTIASMRSIDKSLIPAAASMGASRSDTYFTIYLPLAMPGIVAGATLVFIMGLGFYVTPAILGGGNVQVVSMRIARSLSTYSNFGASAAIGVVLLVVTFVLLASSLLVRRAMQKL